jgi:CRP-like cAMP-binding protein
MSSFTAFTPSTLRATSTACERASAELTKPLSCTTPLKVSTLISPDFNVASLNIAAFTFVVIMLSSTYWPVLSCVGVDAQLINSARVDAAMRTANGRVDLLMLVPGLEFDLIGTHYYGPAHAFRLYASAQTEHCRRPYAWTMAEPQVATNRLLEMLPRHERRQIVAACESVELVRGVVLYRPMQRLDQIYFPTGGFVSLIVTVHDSDSLEVGLIGDEGAFGIPLALGVAVSSLQAVVQGAGTALSIDATSFTGVLARSRPLARVMDRYVFVQLRQLAQLAACTRFHVVEARLARWLLMTQDRAHADAFYLTHELLGSMLGVRRVGITKAAGALQKRKLIRYSRGNITVLDRRGLMAASCSCYEADRASYASALE